LCGGGGDLCVFGVAPRVLSLPKLRHLRHRCRARRIGRRRGTLRNVTLRLANLEPLRLLGEPSTELLSGVGRGVCVLLQP
jgi:hypothetical protein